MGDCQTLIDALFDVEWFFISYLSALTLESEGAFHRLPTTMKMQYVMLRRSRSATCNYETRTLITNRQSEVEEEVMDYLRLSIDLLIKVFTTPPILGNLSWEAYSIVKEQVTLGKTQRIQLASPVHEFYTWACVIDLGLASLPTCPCGDWKGIEFLERSLIRRLWVAD